MVSGSTLVYANTREHSGGLDSLGRKMVPALMTQEHGALGSSGCGRSDGARRSRGGMPVSVEMDVTGEGDTNGKKSKPGDGLLVK